MRDFRNPRYKVLRDREECIECDLCVRQCANEVHYRDEKTGALRADSMKCVNCQRCTLLCPTRALAITRWPQVDAGSAVWTEGAMDDITAQAQTGGVLLASMGNPKSYHIYWEHLLLNASQVTNPSIDPLREPMETRVVLGSRPSKLRVNERTRTVVSPLPPQLSLDVPIMFSAMSFGSVSLNTQKALAMAARELGTYFNCGEGGLHRDLEPYADRAIVQVASGRFGVDPHYLNAGAAIEIKIGQGAKPGIGGHLPGEKINEEVSRTRMIPEGTDAISPAPHHDIYSIEDLRQLIFSLKEATGYAKPVAVKVAAVHNVAAIASGMARAGADIIVLRAVALGADAVSIGSAALIAMGCHQCGDCASGRCNWGIATQRADLVARLNPEAAAERVVNLASGWNHEIQEMMGGMGINAIDSLRGNRLMLRGVGLNEKELEILGVKYAGE